MQEGVVQTSRKSKPFQHNYFDQLGMSLSVLLYTEMLGDRTGDALSLAFAELAGEIMVLLSPSRANFINFY